MLFNDGSLTALIRVQLTSIVYLPPAVCSDPGASASTALRMLCDATGTVEKKDLSDRDIQIVVDLFRQLRPQQIYAAGDLSDPHGTHRTCLKVSVSAL